MKKPAFPDNEAERLRALQALRLLDTPAEERFDRITRIAQAYFGVPIVLVSLVDAQRQWFKSRQGLDAPETPRDISFCGHAILDAEIFSVPNAIEDPRFFDNPLVAGAPDIRAYHAATLSSPEGMKVGTLCLIDRVPRQLTETDRNMLRDLAALVESELERTSLIAKADMSESREGRLQAVLDTIVDGVISIDERGLIQSSNPATSKLFGYSPEEMIGKNVNMLMPEPYHSQHDGYLHNYVETGEARIIGIGREVRGCRKDGSVFPMELAVGEVSGVKKRLFTGIVRDVSERKVAEENLRNTNDRLTLATQAGGIGVWDYDLVSGELKWDDHMFELYGIQRDQFPGAYDAWQHAIHNDDKTRSEEELKEAIAGGKPFDTEFRVVWPNGEVRHIQAAAEVTLDETDAAIRMTGVNMDITERKKVDSMKSEFISTVSHELRTPLTSIMGSLGLMRKGTVGELSDAAKRMIEIAYNNSDRLVRLINDILDVEKIESGKMEFRMETTDLSGLVQKALDANENYGRELGVTFNFDNAQESVAVRGDADRLTQVVTNLLSNAVKYSPQGGSVDVSLVHINGNVRVKVSDRGTGIPEEFRGRIFQKFSQADSGDTRQKGGTGLGLSICDAIIKSHNGHIGFEDREGGGTSFFFDLKSLGHIKKSEKQDESKWPVSQVEGVNRGRVLVCEDDHDVAGLIQMILEQGGYAVDVAYSATEAKRMLATENNHFYRAMTLDLGLPDQGGVSLIHELREDAATRELPIIVVSAVADDGKRELNGDAIFMVDWMTKPIDQERLLASVLRAPRVDGKRLPKILHVEDDVDLAEIVGEVLQGHGQVTTSSTLGEAIKLLNKETFDLILLDMSLPDGSGEELLAEINRLYRSAMPVIIFSASEIPQEISRHIAAALLKSQANNQDLIDVVDRVLGDNTGNNQLVGEMQ